MDSVSCFRNHLATTPSISIHITCLSPNHGWRNKSNHDNQSSSNQIVIQMSSLFDTPKKIINKICKAIIPFTICFKTKQQEELSTNSKNIVKEVMKQEDDRCLWKKTILMGEKCQPLEFPGAIFYDSEGNQLSEPPKAIPRNSPLISFG